MKRNIIAFLISLIFLCGLAHWRALTSYADSAHRGPGQQVGERLRVPAIAAGSSHSLALKSDGTVVAWGGNYFGQKNVLIQLQPNRQPESVTGRTHAQRQHGRDLRDDDDGRLYLPHSGDACGRLHGCVAALFAAGQSLSFRCKDKIRRP